MSARTLCWSLFGGLTLYSLLLIGLEWQFSQDFVRPFFSDIEGDVPFYAVNTTISVFLLAATGLLFAVSVSTLGNDPARRPDLLFYVSQALFFFYLAADDRFKIHEFLAFRVLHIPDALVMLALAITEVALLFYLGRLTARSPRVLRHLLTAAGLFGVMLFIDALLPADLRLRLSFEDLFKTWACVFFFLFGWAILQEELQALRRPAAVLQ